MLSNVDTDVSGQPIRSHLQGPSSLFCLTVKERTGKCPKTKYTSTLRNIPEDQISFTPRQKPEMTHADFIFQGQKVQAQSRIAEISNRQLHCSTSRLASWFFLRFQYPSWHFVTLTLFQSKLLPYSTTPGSSTHKSSIKIKHFVWIRKYPKCIGTEQ
jgi:hypothetical protein